MTKEIKYTKCQRFAKILWHYKTFPISIWVYSLLISIGSIFFFGGIHYEFVENDIKIEEINYSNSQREEIHKIIKKAIQTNEFNELKRNWFWYKNKILLIVQDYNNFKIYFDSHAEYDFVTSKKQLEYFILESGERKYEISLYSLRKQTWESVFKHWLKYFTRSFKPGSKYKYLTVWLFAIYPLSLLFIVAIKPWKRARSFSKYKKTI